MLIVCLTFSQNIYHKFLIFNKCTEKSIEITKIGNDTPKRTMQMI